MNTNIPRYLSGGYPRGGIAGSQWIYSNQKMIAVRDVQATSGSSAVSVMVPMFQPSAVAYGVPDTGGSSCYDTSRFISQQRYWQQFAVKGVLLEYYPRHVSPTNQEAQVYAATWTTDLLLGQIPLSQQNRDALCQTMGTERVAPQTVWRKYISFASIAKSQNLKW